MIVIVITLSSSSPYHRRRRRHVHHHHHHHHHHGCGIKCRILDLLNTHHGGERWFSSIRQQIFRNRIRLFCLTQQHNNTTTQQQQQHNNNTTTTTQQHSNNNNNEHTNKSDVKNLNDIAYNFPELISIYLKISKKIANRQLNNCQLRPETTVVPSNGRQ